jgi:hypothetical protein
VSTCDARETVRGHVGHISSAIIGVLLGTYCGIAVLNNVCPLPARDLLPRGAVMRQKIFLNWVERGDRAKHSYVVAQEVWRIAKTHSEAVVACVDLVVPKEDLIDVWGNSMSRDIPLLRAVATKLDGVRQYPSPEAYLDDQHSPARWEERPCA